jgi:hypothetical protein
LRIVKGKRCIDLNIENISKVLAAADYDHDGLQEVYLP